MGTPWLVLPEASLLTDLATLAKTMIISTWRVPFIIFKRWRWCSEEHQIIITAAMCACLAVIRQAGAKRPSTGITTMERHITVMLSPIRPEGMAIYGLTAHPLALAMADILRFQLTITSWYFRSSKAGDPTSTLIRSPARQTTTRLFGEWMWPNCWFMIRSSPLRK